MDEYIRIVKYTVIQCLEAFVKGVNEIFRDEYLRRPNNKDINRLLQIWEAYGFLGMLGFINCMHWEWKNCLVVWQGQYDRGDHRKPTVILEVVVSQDLWIWQAYYGVVGLNNDINVLSQLSVFNDVLQGRAPLVQFAGDIYPNWVTFVKTIPMPQGEKRKLFVKCREFARMDVERAFNVFKSRFIIICGPSHN